MQRTNPTENHIELIFREYKLHDDFPVLVLTPDKYTILEPKLIPKYHFHNCMEIGFCYENEHSLFFENRVYKIKPGDFFVLSPYSIHYVNHETAKKAHCCEYLYIKPAELLRDFYPLELPKAMHWYKNSEVPFIFSRDTHRTIYRLLRLLLSEYHMRKEGYQYAIKGFFQTVMAELTRELSSLSSPDSEKYQRFSILLPALKKIHFHYAQPLNTATLADLCHLSPSAFRALFLKHLGEAHGEYLKRVRLQKACELLYGTEHSVLSIAMEVGFSSLTSFYQCFRKWYHMSPKKWRNGYRSIQKKNISHSLLSPDNR